MDKISGLEKELRAKEVDNANLSHSMGEVQAQLTSANEQLEALATDKSDIGELLCLHYPYDPYQL